VLTAETDWVNGTNDLLALTWCGASADEGVPWKISASEPGRLNLHHPKLGAWEITSPELPKLSRVI
jgi:hypothetical protein